MRVFPAGFGEPLFLVRSQGVHGVEDDGLDAFLAQLFGPAAVVQDGDEEAFGFARPGAGGDDGVLGRLIFGGQPAPGQVLVDKGVERGLYSKSLLFADPISCIE